ncbi:2-C-methyl-D-erythritol 4-phosphate cytidylyltransferase [Marinilongibacter aquaticus]|uniref:2-C-methyl-D-erythritol 4-phosphate cytidylyltransferase n=1 Tax=Marinilongibacter aquaticus TaxID=2975157 RepID=UPI0021BDE2D0|nr:2-C-methyl-D-erythritol 4-phosphate cytidylyltransferase [Marinilongibacter aquaticus]UBM59825.1 2-C-methyl-D-erythritol 4-phosphate cytidylyltransferase [Marinilongibacter aquaticus]
MPEAKKYSIIVAGGRGNRMKTVIAKQFIPLAGKPILAHTVEKFLQVEGNTVICVVPAKDMSFWAEILESNDVLKMAAENRNLITVEGGETRYQSVSNGLSAIASPEGLVAIHDGVRPLISIDLIEKSFEEAQKHGSAVLSIPLKDSARLIEDDKNTFIDRTKVRLIQTPQTFNLKQILDAFALGEQAHFTDDASVYEFAGHRVNLIDGDLKNIKITTPEDMHVAEIFYDDENNRSF